MPSPAAATSFTIIAVHRFGSRAVHCAPVWDCGFPDARPVTQYTADSLAQPIRRVFGTALFRARETVLMVTRKMKAWLQRRRGASVLQPYRDLRRLLGKEVVLAENASWRFAQRRT